MSKSEWAVTDKVRAAIKGPIGGGVEVTSTRRSADRIIDARVVTFRIDGRVFALVGEWIGERPGVRPGVLRLLSSTNTGRSVALWEQEVMADEHAYNIHVWEGVKA